MRLSVPILRNAPSAVSPSPTARFIDCSRGQTLHARSNPAPTPPPIRRARRSTAIFGFDNRLIAPTDRMGRRNWLEGTEALPLCLCPAMPLRLCWRKPRGGTGIDVRVVRSEEHTSELQSLMRISYAVFCLKKKKIKNKYNERSYTK